MFGTCHNCNRTDVDVHSVKTEDDSGLSTTHVCTPCDEFGQGLMTEEQWCVLVGKPYLRFFCKNCGHYQHGSDCDAMRCEHCDSIDWSPR